MKVFVYRSSKKDRLYVYVLDQDKIKSLPAPVLQQLGDPELALEFELTPDRNLSTENPEEVISNLQEHGYHIQMPRDIEDILAELAK